MFIFFAFTYFLVFVLKLFCKQDCVVEMYFLNWIFFVRFQFIIAFLQNNLSLEAKWFLFHVFSVEKYKKNVLEEKTEKHLCVNAKFVRFLLVSLALTNNMQCFIVLQTLKLNIDNWLTYYNKEWKDWLKMCFCAHSFRFG